MSDIKATASLMETGVVATLTLGDAVLTLAFPRENEQASSDMADLVARCEDAFADVLEALIKKVEEVEARA